jgi:hypothetical protein
MKSRTAILFGSSLSFLVMAGPQAVAAELFLTSDNCMACHNGLYTSTGDDVSIGFDWRGTMMASAARDPYWQASVRRELSDHPQSAQAIENECSRCHMPMANVQARAAGLSGRVFANLGRSAPVASGASAQDGVSCTVCHQIEADNLGKPQSFVGEFSIDMSGASPRKAMGPFEVKPPLARFMASATHFYPSKATHVSSSELCATCHTLITEALGPDGKVIGRLPEQVPYLEWQASSYRDAASCASCHMPEVGAPVSLANILSEPRTGVLRHEFLGGNFIIPTMLKRLATAMPALPEDLDRATATTRKHLGEAAAKLTIGDIQLKGDKLETQILVEDMAGHKLPTAYPSRRVWLHVTVKDSRGKAIFETGAIDAHGRIAGNANDDSPSQFEPHYAIIEKPDQVQIYEAILGDSQGQVTTGLLHAVKFLKDNRILPIGFEKKKAAPDVAVHGEALRDDDFIDGSDKVVVRIAIDEEQQFFDVEAELLYQTIGYRWAENLRAVDGMEPRTFTRGYDALAAVSYQRLAMAKRTGVRRVADPTP